MSPYWTTLLTTYNSSPMPNRTCLCSIQAMTIDVTSPIDSVWGQTIKRFFASLPAWGHTRGCIGVMRGNATTSWTRGTIGAWCSLSWWDVVAGWLNWWCQLHNGWGAATTTMAGRTTTTTTRRRWQQKQHQPWWGVSGSTQEWTQQQCSAKGQRWEANVFNTNFDVSISQRLASGHWSDDSGDNGSCWWAEGTMRARLDK